MKQRRITIQHCNSTIRKSFNLLHRPADVTRFSNLLLLLVGLGIAFVLCELGLRLIGFSFPNFRMADAQTGSRLRPGAEFWQREEGEAHIRINSDGLRDREHSKVKPARTMRIAILGDSYAEALQVPLEATFWARLERELNRCQVFRGKTVEVLNFGVSGFGTAQELQMLRYRVWGYNPDIVLLTITTGNDVRNNSVILEPDKGRPFFRLRNGDLVLDDSFRQLPGYKPRESFPWRFYRAFYNHSRTVQLLSKVKNIITRARNTDTERRSLIAERGLDKEVYFEPRTDEWREAWEITEKLIAKIHEEVVARGKRLVVVTLSNAAQVHPDSHIQELYAKELGIKDLFYPDMRIKMFGQNRGIEVITLAPALAKFARSSGKFLHGFEKTGIGLGHWNAEGNLRAGELIATSLCSTEESAITAESRHRDSPAP
jgi:hypothetical protein